MIGDPAASAAAARRLGALAGHLSQQPVSAPPNGDTALSPRACTGAGPLEPRPPGDGGAGPSAVPVAASALLSHAGDVAAAAASDASSSPYLGTGDGVGGISRPSRPSRSRRGPGRGPVVFIGGIIMDVLARPFPPFALLSGSSVPGLVSQASYHHSVYH